MLPEIELD
jgi:hypothetical protein